MAVDLLAIFTKGLWKRRGTEQRALEVIAPFDVQVETQAFEVTVDFIFEEGA